MRRLTLDTNALIDLEAQDPTRPALLELASAHREKRVRLCVPAIIASERQQGPLLSNFTQFQERLTRGGIADAEVLPTMGRFGLAYYDWFVWADEGMAALEEDIHHVLFPDRESDYARHADAMRLPRDGEIEPGWRNRRCDVLAMWSHITYGADAFVTSDDNFHRPVKRAALLGLGAKVIVTPESALSLLRSA